MAALRQLDTRIANLTKREGKVTEAITRQRRDLDTLETDLAALQTELATATAERREAAAQVAIPSGNGVQDLDSVAHASIQALIRVGQVAGKTPAADRLREHTQQYCDLIRAFANETTASAKAVTNEESTKTRATARPPMGLAIADLPAPGSRA